MTKSRIFLASIALFLVTGCANLANGIGAAALSIDTIAATVADECANPTPQSGCVVTSLVSTEEARDIKRSLQTAQDAVNDANTAYNAGNSSLAGTRLQTATVILESVRAILIRRGIE